MIFFFLEKKREAKRSWRFINNY